MDITGLGTTLTLGIFLLDGLGILLFRGAWVFMQDTGLHEGLGLGAVVDLLIKVVNEHMLLELLLLGLDGRRGGGFGEDVLLNKLMAVGTVLEILLKGVTAGLVLNGGDGGLVNDGGGSVCLVGHCGGC